MGKGDITVTPHTGPCPARNAQDEARSGLLVWNLTCLEGPALLLSNQSGHTS